MSESTYSTPEESTTLGLLTETAYHGSPTTGEPASRRWLPLTTLPPGRPLDLASVHFPRHGDGARTSVAQMLDATDTDAFLVLSPIAEVLYASAAETLQIVP